MGHLSSWGLALLRRYLFDAAPEHILKQAVGGHFNYRKRPYDEVVELVSGSGHNQLILREVGALVKKGTALSEVIPRQSLVYNLAEEGSFVAIASKPLEDTAILLKFRF
jgi:hypothetical protein